MSTETDDAEVTTNKVLSDIDSLLGEDICHDAAESGNVGQISLSTEEIPSLEDVVETENAVVPSIDRVYANGDIDDSLLDEDEPPDDAEADKTMEEWKWDPNDLQSMPMDELLELLDNASSGPSESSISANKIDFKLVSKRVKEFEKVYKDVLAEVYDMYEDFEEADKKPPRHKLPSVRNYFKYSKGGSAKERTRQDLIGFESLDEYIDNHHPLWAEDRRLVTDALSEGGDAASKLAAHVRGKWGGQEVDTSANMSVIFQSSGTRTKETGKRRRFSQYREHLDTSADYQARNLNEFCSIDIEAVKEKVLQKELERRNLYTSIVSDENKNNMNTVNSNGGSQDFEQTFTKEEVRNYIKRKGNTDNWGVKRTADALFGVEEVFELKRHYPGPGGKRDVIPRSHLDEIVAMEEANIKIQEIYAHPEDEDEEDGDKDGWDLENM